MRRALKRVLFALLIISISAIIVYVTAEVGVFVNSIKLPPLLVEHPVWTLAVLVVIVGLLSYVLWRFEIFAPEEKQAALQRDRQRDRIIMMARVQERLTEQLADSLQGATLQALRLRNQSEAVLAPSNTSLTRPNEPAQEETSIVHAYEEAKGKLLILGEPGAGKSTLLLQLAQHLLTEAQKPNSTLPMPIIFNLSSWKHDPRAKKGEELGVWMVEELHKMYQINRKVGGDWVQIDDILPLLDGWDEVAKEQRKACVDAINDYRQDHGLVPTVVCSRKEEYWSQPRRFTLEHAVEVQPLLQAQITSILVSAGEQLAGLSQALERDEALRKLTSLPLMLNLMILAYQGIPAEVILQPSALSSRQQQVLSAYVERRLQERSESAIYSSEQTRRWLMWLARQMTSRNQTEFYLEEMQPGWLPTPRLRFLYRTVVGLFFGLVFGVVGGLIGWLVFRLVGGLVFGVVGGLIGWLVGGLNIEIKAKGVLARSRKRLLGGVVGGLIGGFVAGQTFGLFGGLIGGVVGGLFCWLVGWLVSGFGDGLFFGVMVALSGDSPEDLYETYLNQSSRLTAIFRASFRLIDVILGFLLGGVIIGLSFGLVGGPVGGLGRWLIGWLVVGLYFGLLVGVVLGGIASVQHLVLRLLLPRRYIHFLDYACRCILLRRAGGGGGYAFIHPLLQDYFAGLP